MTPDELRARLRKVLDDAPVDRVSSVCPLCRGTGEITRLRKTITQSGVAAAIGVSNPQMSRFLAGRGGMRMKQTLALVSWLESTAPGGQANSAGVGGRAKRDLSPEARERMAEAGRAAAARARAGKAARRVASQEGATGA